MTAIDRWHSEFSEEYDHYACFAGFEADIQKSDFAEIYDELDIYDQLKLFAFVCKLIEENQRGVF